MKKTIGILAISSLIFAYGCNKTTSEGVIQSAQQVAESNAPSAMAVVQSVQHHAPNTKLNKTNNINSLLNFIPSDVSVALVSTREYDLDDPEVKALLAYSLKLSERLLLVLAEELDDEEFKLIQIIFDRELKPLLEDYENTAPLWGMDPLGRTDFAMYLTNEHFVVKTSVVDGAVLRTGVENALRAIEKDFDVDEEVFQIEMVNVRGEIWTRYGVVDEEESVLVHYGKDVVTIAIPLSDKANLNAVSATIIPAANPVDESVFGSLDDRPIMLGIANTKGFLAEAVEALSHDWFFSNADPASAVCRAEIAMLAGIFPQTIVRARIDEKTVAFDITTALSSHETLLALQALTTAVMDFSDNKMFASLALSFDVGRSISFFADIGARIVQKPFECDSFDVLNELAELAVSVPKLLASSELDELASVVAYIKALTSFSAYVWNPVLDEDGDLKRVAYAANLLGREPASTLRTLVRAMDEESLAGLTFKKGKVETADLSEAFEFPHVVQSLATDAGLIWTSGKGIDIKVLSRTEPKKTDNFIRFTLDYGALSQINPELFRMDMKFDASLGVDNDGLRLHLMAEF
ncbi:MAG: hypothetical protein FWC40_03420 [Proteobacteria bacterium]|nr:hypothetical protein [Pseudomonadota bacterium]